MSNIVGMGVSVQGAAYAVMNCMCGIYVREYARFVVKSVMSSMIGAAVNVPVAAKFAMSTIFGKCFRIVKGMDNIVRYAIKK